MFKIYSSSAGSGKTYTLTKEYIKLALHPANDSYYRHILAVTFTNAAAQEMKERILGTLQAFAQGIDHPMIGDIVSELFPGAGENAAFKAEKLAELQKQSARIFTRILHGYSDFSVMTIDSFMSRLVGSFTDELGLPFGFETRLDGDLLGEAIEKLLARIGLTGEESLSSLLENYYLTHAREEGSWGALPRQMLNAAGDLLNEQSYLAMTNVSHLTLGDWQQIRKQLLDFIREKEAAINKAAAKANHAISAAGLAPADFFQSSRGIYGYFAGRSQPGSGKLWEAPNSYVNKTIQEDKWHAAKIPSASIAAIDALSPLLKGLFLEIENTRNTYGGRAVLYKSLVSQLYTLSLLNEIKNEFDLLLRQHNQVHISEFNRKIIEIVVNDPVPFIFERLGEKYNHILIDEFQDTSKLQFANLLPLIDNALSNGFFNLIVGDMKQAIYRFRGGDMELLLKLSGRQAVEIAGMFEHRDTTFMTDQLRQLEQNTGLDRLVTNRRSFREITFFNNSFFRHLATADYSGTNLTTEVYDQYFEQETAPSTPSGGHVQIEFFDEKDVAGIPAAEVVSEPGPAGRSNLSQPDLQGNRVISLVGNLHGEGYRRRDIAILCRYKKDAAQLALQLGEAGIPLISDDSLLLANSNYIGFIIRFIRVVHTPGNLNQRLETAILFHRLILKKPLGGPAMDEIVSMSKEPGLDSFLAYLAGFDIRFNASEIYQMGIYELCEQVIARFGLVSSSPAESLYLFRFLDEVLQFETTRVSHPGDFLNWWEATGQAVSISASADADAVRITTIHKSKGLEYPVVLCPYADWKVTPKPGSRLWIDLQDLDYPELVKDGKVLPAAAVPLTKILNETPAGDQYRDEVERVLLENINLTYVAFTRAIQRLYILAALPPSQKDTAAAPVSSVNAWLQLYLKETGAWQQDKLHYVIYEGSAPPLPIRKHTRNERFTISSPAGNKGAAKLSLKKNADRAFNLNTFEKEGNLSHKIRQILSQDSFSDEIPEILKRNIRSGLLRPEELDTAQKKIQRLLTLSPLDEVFAATSTKLNSEMILQGGEVLESDRFVKTKTGLYFVVLLSATDGALLGRTYMKRFLRAYSESGLPNVNGLWVDVESETVENSGID